MSTVGLEGVMRRDDVWMRELRGGLHFAVKAIYGLSLAHQFAIDDLQRLVVGVGGQRDREFAGGDGFDRRTYETAPETSGFISLTFVWLSNWGSGCLMLKAERRGGLILPGAGSGRVMP